MTGRTLDDGHDHSGAQCGGVLGIGGPGAAPGEVDALMWSVTFQRALAVLNRKWVVSIVRALEHGPRRAFQIRNEVKGIQQKVLRDALKTLERDGLVQQVLMREETSSGVGWELTANGRSLVEPVAAIYRWGRDRLGRDAIDLTTEERRREVV
ncbi:MAG: winged helix-turn-helix transcriptional regulator [Acidimicrobiia bacterium]